jgi:hypothetical protein
VSETHRDIRLAGAVLERKRHFCAFFSTRDEEYQALLPFLTDGIEQAERALHIVDPRRRPEHLRRLDEAGIDTGTLQEVGQLEVRGWPDAYVRGGRFDQAAMLSLIEEVLIDGASRGYPLTRLWANMEWALEEYPGVVDIVEYETRLNYILPRYDDTVVCTYDLSRFGTALIIDILRTHPIALIGGQVHENPFYVPPDALLAELASRKQPASS